MNYYVCVFHKCATNRTRRLFRHVAGELDHNIWVGLDNDAAINQNVDRGAPATLMIYPVGPQTLDAKSRHDDQREPGERAVICVRDPKDVVVSQYWSWKNTHKNNTKDILRVRAALQTMELTEGLVYLLENRQVVFCEGLRDWLPDLDSPYLHTLRFEALLSDFRLEMGLALDHLGVDLSDAGDDILSRMEDQYSFEALSGGRTAGEENRNSHYRKGVAGDWRNHFDHEVATIFDEVYGDVCDRLGYLRALPSIEETA